MIIHDSIHHFKTQKNLEITEVLLSLKTHIIPKVVTSAGFEPATNGAEIRHSIQLNYEAILSTKLKVGSWKFLLGTSYFVFLN